MASFHGKRVSEDWRAILAGAEREGVPVHLNDGQRTVAIQEQRVRDHGLWSPSNPTGAAAPNPNAPHIKRGAPNHAVDINQPDGGLFAWLRHKGVPVVRNVPTEHWHYDPVGLTQFRRVAAKMRKHEQRLAKYRAKAAKLEKAIAARQRQGKASPGQRALNAAYNSMIRKLRKRAF